MTGRADPSTSEPSTRAAALLLAAILALAAFLRWHTISGRGFFFDELWITEISSGHASGFFDVPVGRLVEQPNLVSLAYARPIWAVPFNVVGAIHPPAFFVALRLWRELFGDSMLALRSCSAAWSMLVVLLSFFAARPLAGRAAGLWAALLSAVCMANVDQAQDVRGYTMLQALTLLTAIVLLTSRDRPPSWTRAALVGLGTLLMMSTHYFAAGACAAIAFGAVTLLRGRARWRTLAAIAVGGVAWAVVWLPQLKAQLAYVPETADVFLVDRTSFPPGSTLLRLLAAPYRALVADPQSVTAYTLAGGCVVSYWLMLSIARRPPEEPRALRWFWLALVIGVLGQLAALDLARASQHLEYAKYLSPAGPAICVLLASTVASRRWLVLLGATLAIGVASLVTAPIAKPDMRPQLAYLQRHMSERDVLILGSDHPLGRNAQTTYLFVAHALPWRSHRLAIVVNRATPELLASLPRDARWFYLAFAMYPPTATLPGTEVVDAGPSGAHGVWEVRRNP